MFQTLSQMAGILDLSSHWVRKIEMQVLSSHIHELPAWGDVVQGAVKSFQ